MVPLQTTCYFCGLNAPEPEQAQSMAMYQHETEQPWKGDGNAQWLVDLIADHSNVKKQETVTITVADIQERVSHMKSLTVPGADMIYSYCLKKLAAFHAQTNQLLMDLHPHRVVNPRLDSPDHQGHDPIQLQIPWDPAGKWEP